MGTVNMEDVVAVGFIALVVIIVLFLLAYAYMRGFEDGKRAYYRKCDDAQDAFRSGYNLGYMQGVETERKAQWKN